MTLEIPRKPQRNQRFEVTIDTLDPKGLGEGKLSVLLGPQKVPRTFSFKVRKALPGERVLMRVERIKRGVIEAGVDEVIETSAQRIEPRCQHFGRREERGKGCGGCALQSLGYEAQLDFKRDTILRHLGEAGLGEVAVSPVIGLEAPWYYRNKMEFTFGTDRDRRMALGMRPAGWRREVLELKECFLCSEFVSAFVPLMRQWAEDMGLEHYNYGRNEGFLRTLTIREGKRTGERLMELTTSGEEVAQSAEGPLPASEVAERWARAALEAAESIGGAVTSLHWTQHRAARGSKTSIVVHHIGGQEALHEQMHLPGGHKLRFEIHPRAFFQPNTLQAEVLYAQVIEATGLGERSEIKALDLFCGTGTIGLCLAPYAAHVTGVELVSDAVENARRNAADNGLSNVTFHAGDAGDVLGGVLADERFDLVVVDPPRSGLKADALGHLATLAAPRLVYVSCNPASLARDLKPLFAAGYTLQGPLQPIDMFPHTPHIETIATLALGEG